MNCWVAMNFPQILEFSITTSSSQVNYSDICGTGIHLFCWTFIELHFLTPLSPSTNDNVSHTDLGSTWWLANTNEKILQSWQNPCTWIAVKVPGYFKWRLFSSVMTCSPSIWDGWVCFGGRCCSPFCYFKLRTTQGMMKRGEIWGGNRLNGVKKKKRWKTTAGASIFTP